MNVKGESETKIKQLSGWQGAMRDAERQITQAELRIKQLKESVQIFRRKIASGEQWPGSKAGTVAESAPAKD